MIIILFSRGLIIENRKGFRTKQKERSGIKYYPDPLKD